MFWVFLVLVLCLVISILIAGSVIGTSLIYPYHQTRFNQWDEKNYPIKFIDGLAYIYDRNNCPEGSPSQTTLLFSHGNICNITQLESIRRYCREIGVNLVVYDYYGYGTSQVMDKIIYSPQLLEQSITRIYQMIRTNFPKERIVLMGESLGSYPTSYLYSKIHCQKKCKDISGLILCVPFDRLSSVINQKIGWISTGVTSLLGQMDNLKNLEGLNGPSLIISARYDEVMPLSCGRNLYECLDQPKTLEYVPTTHNRYLNEGTKEIIRAFLQREDLI